MSPALLPGEFIVDGFARVSRGLELRHSRSQLSIVRRPVDAKMHAPMAIRAQRYDVRGVVRAAVAHSANVVWLEICRAVRPLKGSSLTTAFAGAICTREDIGSDVSASVKDVAHGLRRSKHRLRRLESSCPQRGEIAIVFILVVDDGRDAIERAQLENERVAKCSCAVSLLLNAVTRANVLAFEAQHTIIGFRKEQQALARGGMLGDGSVALIHYHGAVATFADILENSIVPLYVDISVVEPLLTRDQDDERVLGRCDDAALLLPAVGRVNVSTTIVSPVSLKRPRHHRKHLRRLIDGRLCNPTDAGNRLIDWSTGVPWRRQA